MAACLDCDGSECICRLRETIDRLRSERDAARAKLADEIGHLRVAEKEIERLRAANVSLDAEVERLCGVLKRSWSVERVATLEAELAQAQEKITRLEGAIEKFNREGLRGTR